MLPQKGQNRIHLILPHSVLLFVQPIFVSLGGYHPGRGRQVIADVMEVNREGGAAVLARAEQFLEQVEDPDRTIAHAMHLGVRA